MIDIVTLASGGALRDTAVYKAENLLNTQLGDLYYLPEFGIDLNLIFDQSIEIQAEAFKSYITDVMVINGIDILELQSDIDKFLSTLTIKLGDSSNAV